jgi:spore coat protein U-like protein
MRNPILWAVAAALLFLPMAVSAQASGNLTATATVLQPLSAVGTQPLDFGNVFPGVSSTVLPTDVNAGRFDVAGENNAEIDIDFTLPTTLDGTGGTIPIAFESNSAAWVAGGGPFDFDPNTGTTQNLDAGSMIVLLGGTVDPAFDQTAGVYTNTVTMTVAYTGN